MAIKKKPAGDTKAGARTKASGMGSRSRSQTWKPSIEQDLKQVIADHETQEVPTQPDVDDGAMLGIDAPLVRLVNSLIHEAVRRDASDIHLEPFENLLRVRFRMDGSLEEIQKIPHKLTPAMVSRIKIMADLDICEKRIPQDGVINFRMDDVAADLRVSTLPSVFGEKVVMRVLGTTDLNNDISKVGMPENQLKPFREAVNRPDGMVLVTGPTGSGKTTTLYAALNELNDISVSVFTAEDPVEGNLQGVTQCQVNTAVGFTFSSILRSFLRQDPDVILVGEIRDQETAEIAIKASLTGHLVLSTLHTNCAVSTIQRLVDIGIAPYLLTSSINCIVAQRLVRKICEDCKEEHPVSPEMFESLGLPHDDLGDAKICRGKGCDSCHGSGFKGRVPVFEILVLNDELRRLILKGASKAEIKRAARVFGMLTLREAGLELLKTGMTTVEEVLGRTNEDEETHAEALATYQTVKNVEAASTGETKEQISLDPTGQVEEASQAVAEINNTAISTADNAESGDDSSSDEKETLAARWAKKGGTTHAV